MMNNIGMRPRRRQRAAPSLIASHGPPQGNSKYLAAVRFAFEPTYTYIIYIYNLYL